ncbi:MAG: MoaD/ThiS family protein [Acidimicrobiales bacterium]
MARVLFLGPARDVTGVREAQFDTLTLTAVLAEAVERYGAEFASELAVSQVWVNGERADPSALVGPDDEVAVLPRVSGGCRPRPAVPTGLNRQSWTSSARGEGNPDR